MAPRVHQPKMITSPEASDAAGFDRVLHDLKHVAACCKELSDRGEIITPFHDVAWALFTSALVHYRRCFNSGCRVSIEIKQCKFLSDEERARHDNYIHLVDKHIAHSVNGFERVMTTVYIAENEDDGSLVRGAPSYASMEMGFALHDIRWLPFLANSFANNFVKPRINELKALVQQQIDEMSDDDLRGLQDGYSDGEMGKVHQPRNRLYSSGNKR